MAILLSAGASALCLTAYVSDRVCVDRASRGWRGLTITPAGLRRLQDLRRSLLQPPQQLRPRHTPDSAGSTSETVSATA